jgi:hypothetical protein
MAVLVTELTAHTCRFLIFTRELKSVAFVQFCAGPDINCRDWNSRGFLRPVYANSVTAPLIKPQPLSVAFPTHSTSRRCIF